MTSTNTHVCVGTVATAFRRARLPLIAYYVVTIALPLANGSGNTGTAFLEHLAFVLLAPPTTIMFVAVVLLVFRLAKTLITDRRAHHWRRMPPPARRPRS